MAKKTAEADRKARVEQMRKAQQATERRRTVLTMVAAGTVVVVLVGVVVGVVRNSLADRDPTKVGVAASAASCNAPTTDPTSGTAVHVGPGTNQPDKTTIKYSTVPPTSGEHYAQPEYPSRPFYTVTDRPRMETLVHNLEHGYTIVWYVPSLPQAQQDQLKKLADLIRKEKETNGKFIVSAWDDAYGTFPAGRLIGMSHWGKEKGHREMCGAVSGAAITTFVKAYPATDAPEPNAS